MRASVRNSLVAGCLIWPFLWCVDVVTRVQMGMAWLHAVDRINADLVGLWTGHTRGVCNALLLSLFVVMCSYVVCDTIDAWSILLLRPRDVPQPNSNPEPDWAPQLLRLPRWEEVGDGRWLSVAAAAPAA